MARREFPDCLTTSFSQLRCWLKCPRLFELKYVRGLPPAFVPMNLAFGSAIHEALAAYYGEIKSTGAPLRRDLLLDVFRSSWEKALDADVPLQQEDDDEAPSSIIDKGISMLHAFAEHAAKAPPFEVEAVERGFTVPLHDPDTGEQLEESLTGFMDLVIVEDGQRIVVEHKTAARKYGQELKIDQQVTAYKLAARATGLGDVGLRFQVLVKTKVPAIQVEDVHRDEHDEEDFLRTAVGVLKAIDAGVSFPLRSWACSSCAHRYACSGAS